MTWALSSWGERIFASSTSGRRGEGSSPEWWLWPSTRTTRLQWSKHLQGKSTEAMEMGHRLKSELHCMGRVKGQSESFRGKKCSPVKLRNSLLLLTHTKQHFCSLSSSFFFFLNQCNFCSPTTSCSLPFLFMKDTAFSLTHCSSHFNKVFCLNKQI